MPPIACATPAEQCAATRRAVRTSQWPPQDRGELRRLVTTPPAAATDAPARTMRSLFVSDVHLGCRFCDARTFLRYLQTVEPETLYLVGDILDGWELGLRWHWEETYTKILRRLRELAAGGARVVYLPGNHDAFMRDFLADYGWIEVRDEVVHETADGRRLLVMHGDQFDDVCGRRGWLAKLGSVGYNLVLRSNWLFNCLRAAAGRPQYWSFSATLKRLAKRWAGTVRDFETSLVAYARRKGCDGVVCGHLHTPAVRDIDGLAYLNTGDWVETCSCLVEDFAGAVTLHHTPTTSQRRYRHLLRRRRRLGRRLRPTRGRVAHEHR